MIILKFFQERKTLHSKLNIQRKQTSKLKSSPISTKTTGDILTKTSVLSMITYSTNCHMDNWIVNWIPKVLNRHYSNKRLFVYKEKLCYVYLWIKVTFRKHQKGDFIKRSLLEVLPVFFGTILATKEQIFAELLS